MKTRLILLLLGGFAIGAAIAANTHPALSPSGPRTQPVQSSGAALIGGAYALTDHKGQPVTEKSYYGKWQMVFFGFTHCPDICPTKLSTIRETLDLLGERAKLVTPIFITVDPERDTSQVMADYIGNFGEDFVGLTGSVESVRAVAKAYRVFYTKVQLEGSALGYTMDHSAYTYVMNPKGEYVTHFAYGTKPEEMAKKLTELF